MKSSQAAFHGLSPRVSSSAPPPAHPMIFSEMGDVLLFDARGSTGCLVSCSKSYLNIIVFFSFLEMTSFIALGLLFAML